MTEDLSGFQYQGRYINDRRSGDRERLQERVRDLRSRGYEVRVVKSLSGNNLSLYTKFKHQQTAYGKLLEYQRKQSAPSRLRA